MAGLSGAEFQLRKEKTLFVTETERLSIRYLELDDLPGLTDILSDPEVMRYSVSGVCDQAMTRNFIEWCLECYASHGVGHWALTDKQTGELAGFCGVGPEQVGDTREMNLGYRLARRYWGKGLATEASLAVIRQAAKLGRFESVVVIIQPEHLASLRVAEKAGFRRYEEIEFHGRPVRLYRMDLTALKQGSDVFE